MLSSCDAAVNKAIVDHNRQAYADALFDNVPTKTLLELVYISRLRACARIGYSAKIVSGKAQI